MLPIEPWCLLPSVIIGVVVFSALKRLRHNDRYPLIWRCTGLYSLVACAVIMVQLAILMRSELRNSPANPGGPTPSVFDLVIVFLLQVCVIYPGIPILLFVGLLPPRAWRRTRKTLIAIGCLIYLWLWGRRFGMPVKFT